MYLSPCFCDKNQESPFIFPFERFNGIVFDGCKEFVAEFLQKTDTARTDIEPGSSKREILVRHVEQIIRNGKLALILSPGNSLLQVLQVMASFSSANQIGAVSPEYHTCP